MYLHGLRCGLSLDSSRRRSREKRKFAQAVFRDEMPMHKYQQTNGAEQLQRIASSKCREWEHDSRKV